MYMNYCILQQLNNAVTQTHTHTQYHDGGETRVDGKEEIPEESECRGIIDRDI